MKKVILSRRATHDLECIFSYSVGRWGEIVAKQHQDELANKLKMLEQFPDLLHAKEYSESLRFYFTKHHTLTFLVREKYLCLLHICPSILKMEEYFQAMEPELLGEAAAIFRKLQ
jgi:plasmid stabilization system protein ParE